MLTLLYLLRPPQAELAGLVARLENRNQVMVWMRMEAPSHNVQNASQRCSQMGTLHFSPAVPLGWFLGLFHQVNTVDTPFPLQLSSMTLDKPNFVFA